MSAAEYIDLFQNELRNKFNADFISYSIKKYDHTVGISHKALRDKFSPQIYLQKSYRMFLIDIIKKYNVKRESSGDSLKEVSFKKIDASNIEQVRKVSLNPHQTSFIETVDECLEEAKEYPAWNPVAIYYSETVVGFAMYGSFGPNRDTWIDRIIIDRKYQGQGLGRKAMEGLIKLVSKKYNVDVLYLSIVEENEVAYQLYTSLGFEYMEDEEEPNGELIFKYDVP